MLRLNGIKLKPGEPVEFLIPAVCKALRITTEDLVRWRVSKESVDARNKGRILLVYNVDVELPPALEAQILNRNGGEDARIKKVEEHLFVLPQPERTFAHRPIVCGFGPCGIFAALIFARSGLRPVILERGGSMEDRIRAVSAFWDQGQLDPACNVQFGEGGAGTFSDGKLTTGTGDPLNRFILSELVAAGAPEDILYKQKPHVGTDQLRMIVVNLRESICNAGGEIRFNTCMDHLELLDGRVTGVGLSGGELLPADTVVLALGHSARDSFRTLHSQSIAMAQKPFSIGVRIEHLQREIDMGRYGKTALEAGLPPAEYKLAMRTSENRGVYTFCMCPGGYVVASASMEGGVVTNGMSFRNRAGDNANSAVLVDVYPSDYGSDHPLAGIAFQENWERRAFEAGGANYNAPAERLGDFLGTGDTEGKRAGQPKPTYRPGVTWTKVETCLPPFAAKALREAFPRFGRMLPGFDLPAAVLTAPESRSSSPVRILRNEKKEALDVRGTAISGLYPAGEGAGYAGGIMSAAADGIHSAMAALRSRE
ncbi:MAG TPA: hypothetical protein DF480_00815 [Clostridiales bacterium]|nr:hypothetical protein [Clostridiales bacterium]